jgi:hypothetical protein
MVDRVAAPQEGGAAMLEMAIDPGASGRFPVGFF